MRKKYGIRLQFNTIITKSNVQEIYKLVEIGKINKIPITSRLFSTHLLDHITNGNYDPQLFTFNTEKSLVELDKLIANLIELKKSNPLITDSRESLMRIPKIARGIEVPFDCPAGKYTLNFNTQGNIYSCVDEMIKGHCFHQDLKEDQIFDENVLKQTIKKCSALCTACAELQTSQGVKHPLKFLFNFPK